MQNAENCMKVAITPWKSDFFHIRKITFFQGSKKLEISSKFFGTMKKRFLLDSENSLFHGTKTK